MLNHKSNETITNSTTKYNLVAATQTETIQNTNIVTPYATANIPDNKNSSFQSSPNKNDSPQKRTPFYKVFESLTFLKIQSKKRDFENKNSIAKGNNAGNDNLGFEIKNILIDCKFNGEDCTSEDFVEFYSYEYGNCFTFNLNKTSTKSVSRTKTGLQMELFTGIPGNYSIERGMYVTVHNKSMIPLTKYEGVKAAVGTSTDIGITRTFRYKLPDPYSDCRKNVSQYTSSDSYYFKFIIDNMNNTLYTQTLCYQVCFQDLVNQKCGCADPTNTITLNQSISICENRTKIESCIPKTLRNCLTTNDNCECAKYCPLECDSLQYTTSVRSAFYVLYIFMLYFLPLFIFELNI
jgi:hypothetical protein